MATGGEPRLMHLRYAGVCEACAAALPARSQAWYDPARRTVRCLECSATETPSPDGLGGGAGPGVASSGEAGASARREYERRSARHQQRLDAKVEADTEWRQRVKLEHPWLGRIAAAVAAPPDTRTPQHVRAWETGADGERRVGRRLDEWAAGSPGRFVLHDRRIPGTRANIDHLVVAPPAVWVVDTKEYTGRVELANAGGMFRPDWRLKVAGRDRSKLAEGVLWQMGQVAEALDRAAAREPRPPVYGVLCFVGAEWSLFSRPFTFRGVHVAWPAATVDLLTRTRENNPASGPVSVAQLSAAFPPA